MPKRALLYDANFIFPSGNEGGCGTASKRNQGTSKEKSGKAISWEIAGITAEGKRDAVFGWGKPIGRGGVRGDRKGNKPEIWRGDIIIGIFN